MYRESLDSMAGENARLRAEVHRLRADAEVAERMTAPKRAIRLLGVAIVASAVLANLCGIAASNTRWQELGECTAGSRGLRLELDQSSVALAREREALDTAERELGRERALTARLRRLLAIRDATDDVVQ